MLLGTVLPWRRAHAQEPPAPSPPVAAPPPAEAPAPEPEPAPPGEDAAYEAFNRGSELYEQGRYQEALDQFELAYRLLPTFEVLYNIAGANLQLARWAHARRALELYLKLGAEQIPPARVAQVQEILERLKPKTATLTLNMNVQPGEVRIDAKPVELLELNDVVLEPGAHELHVTKPGFRPERRTVHLEHGERLQVVLQLMPEPTPPPAVAAVVPAPAPIVEPSIDRRWLCWGITGALAIGWGTTAVLAIKARHDRNIIERPGTPAEDIDDARRLHERLAIASDVLLASTLVSGGVAAYFTWWADDAAPASGTLPMQRRSASDGWLLGVSGRF